MRARRRRQDPAACRRSARSRRGRSAMPLRRRRSWSPAALACDERGKVFGLDPGPEAHRRDAPPGTSRKTRIQVGDETRRAALHFGRGAQTGSEDCCPRGQQLRGRKLRPDPRPDVREHPVRRRRGSPDCQSSRGTACRSVARERAACRAPPAAIIGIPPGAQAPESARKNARLSSSEIVSTTSARRYTGDFAAS